MLKNEITDLLTRVKVHYSNFRVAEEVISEWFRVLHAFKLEETYKAFDTYRLTNAFQPKPSDIENLIPRRSATFSSSSDRGMGRTIANSYINSGMKPEFTKNTSGWAVRWTGIPNGSSRAITYLGVPMTGYFIDHCHEGVSKFK